MSHQINASIQIVPKSASQDSYDLVDKAILEIRQSGIKHMVTPLETIVEGSFEEVIIVFNKAIQAVAPHAEEVLVFTKMHLSAHRDITFEEKTAKWDQTG